MATYANVGHVLLKRGNTIQQNTYTGPLGELTFDTDLYTVRVHDNATLGGITTLATQAQINSVNNSIALTNSNLANVIVSTNSNLATAVSTINNNISAITGFDSNVVANLSALLSDASIQQATINNIEANVLSLQNNPVYANANVSAYLTSATITTTGNITAGNLTTSNLTASGNVVQQSAYYERYGNISNTGGNLTCNFNLGTVFYANLSANVTANFTNVNAISSTVTGATIIVDQGATAYRVANVQVNGVNQTVKWVGAAAGAGTASNTDIMSFSLINLGGGAYRVLGQISNYG
jgi:hypothetical protein